MPTIGPIYAKIIKDGQLHRVRADRGFYLGYLEKHPEFQSRIAALPNKVEVRLKEQGLAAKFDRELIFEAAGLCVYAHRNQRRDVGGKPYADHPFALAEAENEVLYVTNQEELIADLLHDVVEDTEFDIKFIR